MPRNKVNLEYIPHDSTRHATLQKRSQSLMKKAGEVAILCDTKACIIIYGEDESVPPQVYSSHADMVDTLNRFKAMKEQDKFSNKMDQDCFLAKRICKLRDQADKTMHGYEENEIRSLVHKTVMSGHVGLSIQELTNVGSKVEVLLQCISKRITKIRGKPSASTRVTPTTPSLASTMMR